MSGNIDAVNNLPGNSRLTKKIFRDSDDAQELLAAVQLITVGYSIYMDNLDIMEELVFVYDTWLLLSAMGDRINNYDEELCNNVLSVINKLKVYSNIDKKKLSMYESNIFYVLGKHYESKDYNVALDWLEKSNIDYTPAAASEMLNIHLEHANEFVNLLYKDVENLKRVLPLGTDMWHMVREKSLAYYTLSYLYRVGAPNIPQNISISYKYMEEACETDPSNDILAKEKSKYKKNIFGKVIYHDTD